MKRLFSVSVTDYSEVERIMNFYNDLGYVCKRDNSDNYKINIGIKENGKYAF